MSLEVVCGPMFSGKSSYIYSIVKRYSSIGTEVLVIKPSLDSRYSDFPEVVTHDGVKVDCIVCPQTLMNIPFELTKKPTLIIVEEAQFFIDLVVFVKSMVDYQNKHMVIVGLDGDYNRKPFGQLLECIPLADKVTKLTSLCSKCADGTPALFSYRKKNVAEQVCVGGKDEYIPLCRKCFIN